MSIWFLLWFVLSFSILFFMGWTFVILLKQKSAWKAFAQKHKLRYKTGKIMVSPEMDGIIDGYKFNFLTSEHTTPDLRGLRKMTAVEITLSSTLPMEGGLASGGMVPILKAMEFKTEIRPEHAAWNTQNLAVTNDRDALTAYLTPARLQAFTDLTKIKNTWVILVFKNGVTLLRIDTANPLETPEKLEKIKKILLKSAHIFELEA